MTIAEAHIAFKLELDKTSSLDIPAFEPEEIDFWLYNGVRKFVKTRYSGTNVRRESFEQTQKRMDDLRTLVKYQALPCVSNSAVRVNSYLASLTSLTYPYWFTLSEEVKIGFTSITDSSSTVPSGSLVVGGVYRAVGGTIIQGTPSVTTASGSYFIAIDTVHTGTGHVVAGSSSVEPVKEATADTLPMLLQSPYSEHILHYEKASPLRLFLGDSVELITDGQYQPLLYNIRYLRKPTRVNIMTTAYTTSNANIKEGIVYLVSSSSVTYNEVTYSAAQSFTGVSGVMGFTGTGTATMQTATFDLPEHTHDEIVRLAVNMALENIEQPRYQSHMNEVVTME